MIAKAAVAVAALMGSAQISSADPYARWIEVVNHGNSMIDTIYVDHVDRDHWYEVVLSRKDAIYPGDSIVVEPVYHEGYCRFDILVIYKNGTEVPFWDRNLCVLTELNVTDTGYLGVAY